jgi:hypothetical protein
MYVVTKRAWCDIQTAAVTFQTLPIVKSPRNVNYIPTETQSNKNVVTSSKMGKNCEDEVNKLLVFPITKLS